MRHTPIRTHCGCTWGLGVVTDLTGIGAHRCAVRCWARPVKTVKACAAKTVGSLRGAITHCSGGVRPLWIATDWVTGRSLFGGHGSFAYHTWEGIRALKQRWCSRGGREAYGILGFCCVLGWEMNACTSTPRTPAEMNACASAGQQNLRFLWMPQHIWYVVRGVALGIP